MNDVIDLTNAKVLMVDDTPANIDVLRKVLSPEGYKLSFANSGEKAIQLATRTLPDLILLDVMMPPGIDGFETCRRLKQQETTRDIPIIFITAKTDTDDLVEGFRIGAVDYITKPFKQEEVCVRVQTHVRTRLLIVQRDNLIGNLRASEERFHLLSSWSSVGIFQTDPQGNILYTNHPWQNLFGLTVEQAHGHNWLQMVHPEDQDRVQQLWNATMQTCEEFTTTFRIQTSPAGFHKVQIRATAIYRSEEQVEGFVGIMTRVADSG